MRRVLFFLQLGLAALAACMPAAATRTTTAPITASSTVTLAPDDRIRIAEAFRLGDAIGDSIWPGWTSAPFAVLLVTPEREFLVRHPRPSADFARIGYDSLLRSEVLVRTRTLSPSLLATFPAVGGVSTIVVGQPRATGKSSTEWALTLLHEHFHQLQASRPDYYARVAALDLARGDKTGMWMLNYAFPYDSSAVQARFGALAAHLDSALSAIAPDVRQSHWLAARVARAALRAALPPDAERYLAFQLWQEGVARYTELIVARFAARRFTPSAAFVALPDFIPFDAAAARVESGIHAGLRAPLARDRRVAFYPVGAATALLLDEENARWREEYVAGEMKLAP
ncbi:MAG TPA: hypothetical protein VJT85_06365 [Gemmatimonadaceae bacterium]|nr:hypothetical protein [Gemmatimonadaceae bacterium]